MFADDTKLYASVGFGHEETLQDDLDSLHSWSQRWQLPFNVNKCKVLHYGKNNEGHNYLLNATPINEVTEEKDLGVTFDPQLNFAKHFDGAIAKANSRVGIIRRSFRFLNKESFVCLYKSLVRPILEYCSVVTNPLRKQEADRIEAVQRRATKLIPELRELPYEGRLRALNLPSLTYRRKRADMLQTFRIFEKVDDLAISKFFEQPAETEGPQTRTNGRKILKKRCNTKVRSNAFSQRVVDSWNSLPADVVSSGTVNHFKHSLEKTWKNRRFDY
jgi:hypothetical protein